MNSKSKCKIAYSDGLSVYNNILSHVNEAAKKALEKKNSFKVNKENYWWNKNICDAEER